MGNCCSKGAKDAHHHENDSGVTNPMTDKSKAVESTPIDLDLNSFHSSREDKTLEPVMPHPVPTETTSSSTNVEPEVTIETTAPTSITQPEGTKSDTNKEKSVSLWDSEVFKIMAITKIQRTAKRNAALRAARAETQWKLFAELDTRDEAEMLSLAVFMQTLLDTVAKEAPDHRVMMARSASIRELNKSDDEFPLSPQSSLTRGFSEEVTTTSARIPSEDGHVPPPPPPSVDAGEFDQSTRELMIPRDSEDNRGVGLISLQNVTFSPTSGAQKSYIAVLNRHNEYDFCHVKKMTPLLVEDVIRIFREDKYPISKNSVIKLLRYVYKALKAMPNMNEMNLEATSKLTVVGDTHGQLSDLFYILETCGLPNENNKFIFNGDFVDRGKHGFEVVFLIFLLFVVYGPGLVALNRGNHEEQSICRVYGFEKECNTKYDHQMYEMFMEVFKYLPLFSLVNQRLFVVHGGLFHSNEVTLEDLRRITRHDFKLKPTVPYPANCEGKDDEGIYQEYLKQLEREALWSDPIPNEGVFFSSRGAGVCFGPNIARGFMQTNGLDMVIRSHENVYQGIQFPFEHVYSSSFDSSATAAAPPLLCTLFSASNYQHGSNYGAIMQFATHPFGTNSVAVPASFSVDKGLSAAGEIPFYYSVIQYRTSLSRLKLLVDANRVSLRELILRKKSALLFAFEAVDVDNDGQVTRLEWSEVMQRITMIKILWLSIIHSIVPEESLSPSAVNYRKFIDEYTTTIGTASVLQRSHSSNSSNNNNSDNNNSKSSETDTLDDIYGQRKKLEQIFYFFDANGDGVISKEELLKGTELVNKSLPPDCQLKNIDRMLELMDFDGSGSIDINEFFETFRILDAKDGQVDGVLSLAQQKSH